MLEEIVSLLHQVLPVVVEVEVAVVDLRLPMDLLGNEKLLNSISAWLDLASQVAFIVIFFFVVNLVWMLTVGTIAALDDNDDRDDKDDCSDDALIDQRIQEVTKTAKSIKIDELFMYSIIMYIN